MAGKKGQKSKKPAALPAKYKPRFLKTMDRRTRTARRLRDQLAQLVSDQGGMDNLSYVRRQLCERLIWLCAMTAEHEKAMAAGHAIDEGNYRGHINSMIGLARTLGLDRVAASLPRALDYAAQLSEEEAVHVS